MKNEKRGMSETNEEKSKERKEKEERNDEPKEEFCLWISCSFLFLFQIQNPTWEISERLNF